MLNAKTAFILVGCIAAGLISGHFLSPLFKTDVVPEGYHVTEILEEEFFEIAYEQAPDLGDRKEARVLIVPHHLVAAPFTAAAFIAQAKIKNPRVIVIVGPDHFDAASHPIITSRKTWRTPYGFTHANTKLIDDLLAKGLVHEEPEPFDEEHSIGAVVPFIGKTFPNATIVPLIVKETLSEEVRYAVADFLAEDMRMAIASVDFSHYIPENAAYFHDIKSIDAVSRRAYDELPDLEVDSPMSLGFAFDFAEQTATEEFDLYVNENSNSFFGYEIPETTSYVIGGFVDAGEGVRVVKEKEKLTALFFGDTMFDRGVRLRAEESEGGYEEIVKNIRGLENRFFRGVDVISLNLEGAIAPAGPPEKTYDFAFDDVIAELLASLQVDAVTLANNHTRDQGTAGLAYMKEQLDAVSIGYVGDQVVEEGGVWKKEVGGRTLAMLGFNLTHPDFSIDDALVDIRRHVRTDEHLVVQVHWGGEYEVFPSQTQIEVGRAFVDAGADAVIGHHPHVVQGMEVYNGAPIFWSLGNFVFDQYQSEETRRGLSVGISFSDIEKEIFLLPVNAHIAPNLLEGDARRNLLEAFAERSSVSKELQEQILRGRVKI